MHLIAMLSQLLISYPLWTRLGKWSGSLAAGFSRTADDYELPARPWNLGVDLEVGSPYLMVYSGVRWSSPLRGEGLVRHMSESFRD
jgi:hypothetical protein